MVDAQTDYLKAEFLYLMLFHKCPIIIKPFVLQGKLNLLTMLLDIFYHVQRFNQEDMENFFESENLKLLFDNAATTYYDGKDEKAPLLFFPQITREMYDGLAKNNGVLYIGVHGENMDPKKLPLETPFEKIAVYDKKRGSFVHNHPEEILSSASEKDQNYEWCRSIIEMMRSSPDNPETVLEYLLTIKGAMVELHECFGTGFDPMTYYLLMKDFSINERRVIEILTNKYFNIDIFSVISNPEDRFQKIKLEIEKPRHSALDGDEEINKGYSEKGSLIEEDLSIEENSIEEYVQLSLISDEFYLAFNSILETIPHNEEISNPGDLYCALRQSLWVSGIPSRALILALTVYIQEINKSKEESCTHDYVLKVIEPILTQLKKKKISHEEFKSSHLKDLYINLQSVTCNNKNFSNVNMDENNDRFSHISQFLSSFNLSEIYNTYLDYYRNKFTINVPDQQDLIGAEFDELSKKISGLFS